MMNRIKKEITLNAKNLIGWRTNRKIIVISVDDYGNVRVDSRKAREQLERAGLSLNNRFDQLDSLETNQDLAMLYDALSSVKDKNGRHVVLTPYALPCNINFEKIKETGYGLYFYELLPETYEKLAVSHPDAYRGAWKLWKEGITKGLMAPQFHGREHLNLKVFEEKLVNRDPDLMACLENRSFTGLSENRNETISPLAAFDFWAFEENERFHGIIEDGLAQFEKVFGFRAENFTPPVYKLHPVLYQTLEHHGIRFVDTSMIANKHQGKGEYRKKFNYTGKKTDEGIHLMVRNVVFEPSADRTVDWPSYAIKQIEAAFRWNRPVIVSSHRVNFSGHIDPQNREEGIGALKELLQKIVRRWPEVEFMSANELGELIASGKER